MNADEHPLAAAAMQLLNEAKALRELHNPPHQSTRWGGDLAAKAQYDETLATATRLFTAILNGDLNV